MATIIVHLPFIVTWARWPGEPDGEVGLRVPSRDVGPPPVTERPVPNRYPPPCLGLLPAAFEKTRANVQPRYPPSETQ